MERVLTLGLAEPFVQRLTALLGAEATAHPEGLKKTAVVFGGKRPALFVKRELARFFKKSYFPPTFFTIDELIDYLLGLRSPFARLSDLDACFLIYRSAQSACPDILRHRESFAQFLPWAREILAFIEQLDLDLVSSEALKNIESNAVIGYPIPAAVNQLLGRIVTLREMFHTQMRQQRTFTRGFRYLRVAEEVGSYPIPEFAQIVFCQFYALHRSEEKLLKSLSEQGVARFIFQGSSAQWPALQRNARVLRLAIDPSVSSESSKEPVLKLYSGFDVHSQVGLVSEILKGILARQGSLASTVVVLPDSDHLIPLISEVADITEDFNVSLGYPLKRSSFHSLLQAIFKAQLTRRDTQYYAKDLLKVLRHPLVKNFRWGASSSATRVLIHKVEELLSGQVEGSASGKIFVTLAEIFEAPELYESSREVLRRMGESADRQKLEAIMAEIGQLVFAGWEHLTTLEGFATQAEIFVTVFIEHSFASAYPLNMKIAQRILELTTEMRSAEFCREPFSNEEIFKIFFNRIEHDSVAFIGSPLKGLQILGLMETRALNFDHVIIMDANEGTLPKLRIYDPLIPREVMVSLSLDRLEEEEEIQRYQFRRLLAGAKEAHLVFAEAADKEKSRFLEELIWERQKATQQLDGLVIHRAGYDVALNPKRTDIPKTPEVLAFLTEHRFSASSLNTYTRCPLRFYYKYVLGLEEKEDLLEEPENRQVGTFVHELLEETWGRFLKKKPVLDRAFEEYFFKVFENKFNDSFGRSMKSDAFLLKSVLEFRMRAFLEAERERLQSEGVEEIVELEKRFEERVNLAGRQIRLVYQLDRIDRLADGTMVLLDYKTGSEDPLPKDLPTIAAMPMTREEIKKNVRSFQMPMYVDLLNRQFPNNELNAVFYNLRSLERKAFLKEDGASIAEVIKVFSRPLEFIVNEILDASVNFRPDDKDPRYCGTCPFYDACR